MVVDLLERRRSKFTLWTPGQAEDSTPPQILLSIFNAGPPATVSQIFQGPLQPAGPQDLWELDPNTIRPSLNDGTVYHYWFIIQDTSPENLGSWKITDPLAYTVDYRLTNSRDGHAQPASVIKFQRNKLWPCDINGSEPGALQVPEQSSIPDNNHLVIYELPASWAKSDVQGGVEVDVGTFADVLALFNVGVIGARFSNVPPVANEAILSDLGINALELLPAADAKPQGEWGYATAHYFAPDSDLGSSSDLVQLVDSIHSKNIRLFIDVVMAFGHDPYIHVAFKQFHIEPPNELNNPDSYQSHSDQLRDGYGGRPWRYIQNTQTYDPLSGNDMSVHPSWAFHKLHLHRWMSDFEVDGLRLDSVNNIANYGFIKAFKDEARSIYRSRASSSSEAKFLVIGEELSCPKDLLTNNHLDALWNEPFQGRLRAAILGENSNGDDFEWTIRKMADCRLDSKHSFRDCSTAINYITSHDTEEFRKERLYDFLSSNRVADIERRSKLAFACLLTAVGIPMIFAGEEFCDQMDQPVSHKQSDPVNYERKAQDWRSRVFNYVSGLVRLRKHCPALGGNDTEFIHVDDSRGGKIMAWKRGGHHQAPVVIVANFSDEDTPGPEYYVRNWPDRDRSDWREVTQNRAVPAAWVGREPLFHWEAKVYTY